MTKSSLLAAVLVGVILVTVGVAQKNGPTMPYIDKGACPFECCTYREWNTVKPTSVRTSMSDTAPVGFRLKAGEKVTGVTGVVITAQPGIARAMKNGVIGEGGTRIKKGEQFYVLTNLGEGFTKVWFKGRTFDAETYDDSKFKIVRQPKSVWWVKIKNRGGKIGWSRQPENFGNVDQCG